MTDMHVLCTESMYSESNRCSMSMTALHIRLHLEGAGLRALPHALLTMTLSLAIHVCQRLHALLHAPCWILRVALQRIYMRLGMSAGPCGALLP